MPARIDVSIRPMFVGVFGASGMGKTYWLRHQLDVLATRYPRVIVCDPGGVFGAERRVPDLARFFLSGRSGVYRVVADSDHDIEAIGKIIWSQGRVCVVVDELQRYGDAGGFRDRVWYDIVTRGRARGIGLVGATQRPAQVPTTFRGMLSDGVSFRLPYQADAQVVRQFVGGEVAAIQNMAPYECVKWGENLDLWRVPR